MTLNNRQKYNTQKYHAGIRGIEWQFDFEEWISWWGEDIFKRGCKKGQLVMARINDIGPYHPSNVYKSTAEENSREMRIRVKGNNRLPNTYFHSKETKEKISQGLFKHWSN